MALRNSGTDIVKDWAVDLVASIAFLTRLPVPKDLSVAPLSEAMRAFPLAGALIGAAAGLLLSGLAATGLSGLVAAGLALAALAFVTGALHEDGLADTADGFGGGRDREAKLAIMRDSRTGAYGALALLLGVLIKAAALADLAQGAWFLPLAILAGSGALSRALIVWLMASTPPARSDGLAYQAGQPSDFTARRALVAGGAIAFALLLWASGLTLALIVIAAGGAVAWALRRLALAQVGGHTGDIAGAMQFVSETAMLAAASAIIP